MTINDLNRLSERLAGHPNAEVVGRVTTNGDNPMVAAHVELNLVTKLLSDMRERDIRQGTFKMGAGSALNNKYVALKRTRNGGYVATSSFGIKLGEVRLKTNISPDGVIRESLTLPIAPYKGAAPRRLTMEREQHTSATARVSRYRAGKNG